MSAPRLRKLEPKVGELTRYEVAIDGTVIGYVSQDGNPGPGARIWDAFLQDGTHLPGFSPSRHDAVSQIVERTEGAAATPLSESSRSATGGHTP